MPLGLGRCGKNFISALSTLTKESSCMVGVEGNDCAWKRTADKFSFFFAQATLILHIFTSPCFFYNLYQDHHVLAVLYTYSVRHPPEPFLYLITATFHSTTMQTFMKIGLKSSIFSDHRSVWFAHDLYTKEAPASSICCVKPGMSVADAPKPSTLGLSPTCKGSLWRAMSTFTLVSLGTKLNLHWFSLNKKNMFLCQGKDLQCLVIATKITWFGSGNDWWLLDSKDNGWVVDKAHNRRLLKFNEDF